MDWLIFGLLAMIGTIVTLSSAYLLNRLLRCYIVSPPCPALRDGQKIALEDENRFYSTLIWTVEGKRLWLVPPLEKGLPVSLRVGSPITLRVNAPGGSFSAHTKIKIRKTEPFAMLGVELPNRWACLQRRRYPRITLPEEIAVELQTGMGTISGWAQDISAGGIRIHTTKSVLEGSELAICLPDLPPADNCLKAGQVFRGRLIACDRVLQGTHYEYALRIAFSEPIETFHARP